MRAALRARLARLRRDRRGSLPVELALVLPVLVLLLVGAADVTWLYIAEHKAMRAAGTLADLTARAAEISAADVSDVFRAANQVAKPLDFATAGRAYVSSVNNPGGTGPRIAWQRGSVGGLAVASRLGTAGGSADLAGAITLAQGEELIVAEAFLDVEPLFGLLVQGTQRLYVRSLERPRFGTVMLRVD